MNSFTDIRLLPHVSSSLKVLGFEKPTEIQSKVIPFLIENYKHDIHVQAQTGTGKTLAFGIPLLHVVDPSLKTVQALIIAPTRELVLQISESIKEVAANTGIKIEPIFGGMPINRQIARIKDGPQIIVGTPGRLNDHLRRKTLSLNNLKVLVLDEADIMLEMGFKEEVDAILNYAPGNRQIWLFSATVLPGIKQIIKSHMRDVVSFRAETKGVVTPRVKQYFCVIPTSKRIAALARFIESSPDFYGIIFCQTKVLTTEVMEELISKGFKVNCLHGDMKQTLRNHVIRGFKNKDFNILVATDVAARGIDVSDLTHVINFSIPKEYENYVHRIGRTGRAGKEGVAIVFVAPGEAHKIKRLEKAAQTTLQEISVPPVDAIINVKMGAVADFIEQAKKPDNRLSPVHTVIKELINSFSAEEVQNSLAVALEDKFFKDVVHEKIEKITPDLEHTPQEICLELGRDQGFDEETIRNYLYPTCKLMPQEVHKVRVLNNKTFIAIPENRLMSCIEAMRRSPITQKAHKIYPVKDVFKERRQERDRFGKRRQNRRR